MAYPGSPAATTSAKPAATVRAAAPTSTPEPAWVTGLREALGTQAYDQGTANKVAASQAKAQTAAQLAAYHNAQAQELAAAQGRATQIGSLGTTVADFLGRIYNPQGVSQDYGNAAAGQAALGTGYANQFQANADQQAALAQQQIAASGGQGGTGSQAGSLASALTGLSVNLPANALGIQQLAAVEAAKAAPALSLGYAQQEATGALGAGQEAAAKYNTDIAAAIAGQPALARQYLADYIKNATDARDLRVGDAFKLAGLSQNADAAAATAAYRQSQATATAAYRNRPDVHFGPNGSVYSTDPTTGRVTQLQGPSQVPQVHGSPYSGLYSVDPATGKVTILSEPMAATTPELRSVGNGGLVEVSPDGTVTTIREPAPETRSFGSGGVLRINPDGSTTVVRKPTVTPKSAVIRSIGDGGLVRVNPDGTTTLIRKPTPKAAKGSSTSSTVFNRATKVAQIAFSGPKGASDPLPWTTAMKRVRAYLLGAGVPRKQVGEEAARALLAVGFVKPLPQPKGSFLTNPQGWAAWIAAGGNGASAPASGGLGNPFG